MRWTRGERSSDIEDRRGETPTGGGMGMRVGGGLGLGGVLVLLALSLVFGQNFFALLDGGDAVSTGPGPAGGGPTAPPRRASPAEEQLADFVSFVLDDVQDTWAREFSRLGREYERARLVLFGTVEGPGRRLREAAAGAGGVGEQGAVQSLRRAGRLRPGLRAGPGRLPGRRLGALDQ